jgi:hypothetical protein
VLERGAFRTVLADSIWAAYRRSLELGGHDSNIGPGTTLYRHICYKTFQD